MKEDLIEQLKLLLYKDNFPLEVWRDNFLNMSSPEVCENLNNDYKKLVKIAITQLELDVTEAKLTKYISQQIRLIDKKKYDTEEKELLMERVFELSEILKIDLRFAINRWMHGYILASLINLLDR